MNDTSTVNIVSLAKIKHCLPSIPNDDICCSLTNHKQWPAHLRNVHSLQMIKVQVAILTEFLPCIEVKVLIKWF
jgi:hypothetical protein